MPQTIHHKNAGSISNSKRNTKTGQVTGDDKNGRTTDVETFALSAYGADKCLKELLGFRADDMAAKTQAYASIEKDGYVMLDDLRSGQTDKVAINTLDAYYTAMGFKTNIVYGGNMIVVPSPVSVFQSFFSFKLYDGLTAFNIYPSLLFFIGIFISL